MTYVGTTEKPKGSNRSTQIDSWEKLFGLLGEPWCAMFASVMIKQAGSTPQIWTTKALDFKKAGSFASMKDIINGGYTPKPGDFLVWSYGAGRGHVDCIIEWDKENREMVVIGGNRSDSVLMVRMTLNQARARGAVAIVPLQDPFNEMSEIAYLYKQFQRMQNITIDTFYVAQAFIFIAKHEGYRANAYPCASGKHWLGGYGIVTEKGAYITRNRANQQLLNRIFGIDSLINRRLESRITTLQRVALIDLMYNTGNYSKSVKEITELLNERKYTIAVDKIATYYKSNGKVYRSLQHRCTQRSLLMKGSHRVNLRAKNKNDLLRKI